MKRKKKKFTVRDLCVIGLLAALSYVCFTYIQFKISLPGGDATSVHLGNMVPVLGALLFGGMYGALGGAIGMTIGDLFDPMYVVYAPKTLILKLCIGLITGFVAHRLFHLRERQDKKTWTMPAILSSLAGLVFNSILPWPGTLRPASSTRSSARRRLWCCIWRCARRWKAPAFWKNTRDKSILFVLSALRPIGMERFFLAGFSSKKAAKCRNPAF